MEWLATEKIRVHGSTGMGWGSPENLVPELAALNRLLADHPCFFDGATLTRLSPPDSPVYALRRESAEGESGAGAGQYGLEQRARTVLARRRRPSPRSCVERDHGQWICWGSRPPADRIGIRRSSYVQACQPETPFASRPRRAARFARECLSAGPRPGRLGDVRR